MNNLGSMLPGIKYGGKVFPHELLNGGGYGPMVKEGGNYWFVDGDLATDGTGESWEHGMNLIQSAIDASSAGDVIFIAGKKHTDYTGDPVSYEENLTIPYTSSSLSLIGVNRGNTQGGLPQLKDGSVTTQHILRVRAPGCLISGLGFNGSGNTGGGILFDDDYAAKAAFATTITGCHFKNCKGSTATDCRTGGAINWSSAGNSWQVSIIGNHFYKNVGDVVLPGTSNTAPQDVIIQDNDFLGLASSVDCHLYLTGAGSGMSSVLVDNNRFADVLPSLGSGSIVRYVDMTGCTGMFSNNSIGGSYTTTGFGAAKAAAKIPTTVGITHNYSDAGLIVREA